MLLSVRASRSQQEQLVVRRVIVHRVIDQAGRLVWEAPNRDVPTTPGPAAPDGPHQLTLDAREDPDPIYALPHDPASPEPAGDVCPYCHLPIARCAEMLEHQPDNWRALHRNDPAEVERRAAVETEEWKAAWARKARGLDPNFR